MEGIVSHQSSHSFPYALDPCSYPARPSSHLYGRKPAYPSHHDSSQLYDQSLAQPQSYFHAPQQSLQIHTANPAPHEQDPEEQTAHPSRPTSYHQLQQGLDADHDHDSDNSLPHEQTIAEALTGPHGGLSRPLTHQEREKLADLDRLKLFLATAPSRWNTENGLAGPDPSTLPQTLPHTAHPALNRFLLRSGEYVSCVFWSGLYHITGTDIVRALVFRFEAFGRPVHNIKKFEEGVFSDLRNLKPGIDACLEEPKSPFLDLLFKYQCIRTQKKQKVFYWFSVPHDRLFLDALERDLKREKMGLEATTHVTGEPALSFTYDPKRSLYEQFAKASGSRDGEGELEAAVRRADESSDSVSDAGHSSASDADEDAASSGRKPAPKKNNTTHTHSPFFSMFSLFEGSPTYKQRRKKVQKARKSPGVGEHPFAHPHSSSVAMGRHGMPGPIDGAYGWPHDHHQQMREPHLDRFGHETGRMSAEDMFRAQARGDFVASNPDVLASQKQRQRRAMEQAYHQNQNGLAGPGVAGGVPVPGLAFAAATSDLTHQQEGGDLYDNMTQLSGYDQQQQQFAQQQQQQQQPTHRPLLDRGHTFPLPIPDYSIPPQPLLRSETDPYIAGVPQAIASGWADPNSNMLPRAKAFVCPLFSCGRMFKRMEHLKRHLRTHSLERPFECERCQKRFSRSDNLAQHVRTHERRAGGASGLVGAGVGVGAGEDMGDGEGVGMGDGEDGDGEDDLPEGIASVQMCEVEVRGAVLEVAGDEEGLVTTTGTVAHTMAAQQQQEVFYEQAQAQPQPSYDATQVLRASPDQSQSPYMAGMTMTANSSPDTQWATVPRSHQGSPSAPAFSIPTTATVLTLPQHHQQRLDASYHTQAGAPGEYSVTSISAPSHKLNFDHGVLYPSELAFHHQHQNHNGPGPIRRHRSATPSIARFGESIRRPYSAALSESGQSTGGSGSARSYHPYAVAAHHVSHSAQSSPMAYTVPLAYDAQTGSMSQPPSRHHSRSRSSGQMQEQMMLGMDPVQGVQQSEVADYGAAQPQAPFQGIYRTDSPMQFGGGPVVPSEAFEMDLVRHRAHTLQQQSTQQHQQQAGGGMYAVGLADVQYAQGFYPQSHHTL